MEIIFYRKENDNGTKLLLQMPLLKNQQTLTQWKLKKRKSFGAIWYCQIKKKVAGNLFTQAKNQINYLVL
jgi:hypothetical protein